MPARRIAKYGYGSNCSDDPVDVLPSANDAVPARGPVWRDGASLTLPPDDWDRLGAALRRLNSLLRKCGVELTDVCRQLTVEVETPSRRVADAARILTIAHQSYLFATTVTEFGFPARTDGPLQSVEPGRGLLLDEARTDSFHAVLHPAGFSGPGQTIGAALAARPHLPNPLRVPVVVPVLTALIGAGGQVTAAVRAHATAPSPTPLTITYQGPLAISEVCGAGLACRFALSDGRVVDVSTQATRPLESGPH